MCKPVKYSVYYKGFRFFELTHSLLFGQRNNIMTTHYNYCQDTIDIRKSYINKVFFEVSVWLET